MSRKRDKAGQIGTKWDKWGQSGRNRDKSGQSRPTKTTIILKLAVPTLSRPCPATVIGCPLLSRMPCLPVVMSYVLIDPGPFHFPLPFDWPAADDNRWGCSSLPRQNGGVASPAPALSSSMWPLVTSGLSPRSMIPRVMAPGQSVDRTL